MTPQELKNSILQLAIQGKLVPQDPLEGTGEELYIQIQEERTSLIKDGKLKKGKLISVINEEEIPFELPDSWKWVRLANIWQVLNGDRGKNYPAKSTLSHSGIPFISALNLDGKTVIEDDNLLCLSETQYNKLGNGKLLKGDIVVCIRGSLGKHGRYPFYKGAIASSLVIMRSSLLDEILDDYLMMYLDSPLFFSEIKRYDNGTAQPNLAAKSLEQFLFPLPPLAEQKRIVAKIEELLPLVDRYEEAYNKLEKLNNSFPLDLQKSILQLAIQGKLVPQDPSEGTGEELYKQIQEEKQILVNAGKIKKEKPLPKITDDDIPFDIPESWKWYRIGEVFNIINGFTPLKSNPEFWDNGDIPWFTINDVHNQGRFISHTEKAISKKALSKNSERIVPSDSVLLCCTASIGEYAYTRIPLTTNQQFNALVVKPEFSNAVYPLYVFEFVKTLKDTLIKNAGKTTFNFLSVGKLALLLFPLPPFEEQKRIVSKLEVILPLCEKLGFYNNSY